MQTIILDIITALFGAGIGTALYLVGKNNGKAQAEKEHLQSMRESFLKNNSFMDIMPLFFLCSIMSGMGNIGNTKPATPPSSPANENKSDIN